MGFKITQLFVRFLLFFIVCKLITTSKQKNHQDYYIFDDGKLACYPKKALEIMMKKNILLKFVEEVSPISNKTHETED